MASQTTLKAEQNFYHLSTMQRRHLHSESLFQGLDCDTRQCNQESKHCTALLNETSMSSKT